MTLREFIEQEIRENHVLDIEEFGRKLYILDFEDGEEIQPEEFEDYLDYNLDSASIVHTFGAHFNLMYYEILIAHEEFLKSHNGQINELKNSFQK